jgi:hypothetical protein
MDPEVREVYLQDVSNPSYALQGGKRNGRLNKKQAREKWIWGHFSNALKYAVEHPIYLGN